ncbi:MAG: HTH domain-containing protein [Chloroflexia bacterium]|nr:HTH domain-containing protein [Chloroflexia bacterium]
MMQRVRYADIQVYALLKEHPTRIISYDSISAELDIDRRTVVTAIRRLVHHGFVNIKERGCGACPNQYSLD